MAANFNRLMLSNFFYARCKAIKLPATRKDLVHQGKQVRFVDGKMPQGKAANILLFQYYSFSLQCLSRKTEGLGPKTS